MPAYAAAETFNELALRDAAAISDAQTIGSFFTDTAGTVAVTANGDNVKCVRERTGTYLFTEATHPPIYCSGGSNTGNINGHPALYYANASAQLQSTANVVGATWDKAFTIVLVHKGPGTIDGHQPVVWSASNSYFQHRNGVGGQWKIRSANPYTATDRLGDSYAEPRIDVIRSDGRTTHSLFIKSGATNSRRDPYDLIETLQDAPTTLSLTDATASPVVLGANYGGGFNYRTGSIGFVGMWRRRLDDDELRELLEYLSAKWDIGNLPFILCDGDSRTSGNGTTAGNVGASYPEQMQVLYGNGTIVERHAYPGRTYYQAWGETYDAQLRSWPRACAGRQVVVIGLAYNDLGLSLANTQTAFTRRVAEWLSLGFAPVAKTVYPGATLDETRRTDWNAWLQANYAAVGCVALVDQAADARLQDTANTTYFQSDGIHLKAAGEAVVAGLIKVGTDEAMSIATAYGTPRKYESPGTHPGIY